MYNNETSLSIVEMHPKQALSRADIQCSRASM